MIGKQATGMSIVKLLYSAKEKYNIGKIGATMDDKNANLGPNGVTPPYHAMINLSATLEYGLAEGDLNVKSKTFQSSSNM